MKKIFLLLALLSMVQLAKSDSWTPKTGMSLGRATAFAFSIGTKGYVGGGTNYSQNPAFLKDFWEYNTLNDTWTQLTDFGGGPRTAAVAFSIGGFGYALTGADVNANRRSDLWQYNPGNNTWTQKLHCTGSARNYSVAFSIGNKGYIGTGTDSLGVQTTDFWQYNPSTNTWTQKAAFIGTARETAVGFGIGGKGYIGTGYAGGSTNDFYEYDTLTNMWTPKANVGTSLRESATAFVLNGKGYICTGNVNSVVTNDLLEYNPQTNSWTTKTSKPGSGKSNGAAFSVANKGYMVSGYDNGFNQTADMYQYTPDVSTGINELTEDSKEVAIAPNPFSENTTIAFNSEQKNIVIKITDLLGKEIKSLTFNGEQNLIIDKGEMKEGIYFLQIINENKNKIITRKIIIQY